MHLFQSEDCSHRISWPSESFFVSMSTLECFVESNNKYYWKMLSFKPATTLDLHMKNYTVISLIDFHEYWLLRHCIFILRIVRKIR